jgi:uncharacterized protein
MKTDKQHTRIFVDSDTSVHAVLVQPVSIPQKQTLFVFSHGFSVDGTESYRLFISLSSILLSLGYPCILFDYRGSGYSDLDYEDMTFDTEIADLNAVVDFGREKFPDHQVALWGVSFGCAVAAHVASQRSDISLLILWCLSADLYRRYRERLGPDIEKQGYTYIDKGFKVKRAFLDSLKDRDTYAAIKKVEAVCLLVHGDADTVAPVELSRTAHRIAPENTTLCEIPGGRHGFKLQPDLCEQAIDSTLEWIRNYEKR